MPTLNDLRKTFVVELPSHPDAKITFYEGLIYSEDKEISKMEDDAERGVASMLKMIKDWNLVDDDGQVLPVTEENMNRLPAVDITYLLNRAYEVVKKNNKKILETFLNPTPEQEKPPTS